MISERGLGLGCGRGIGTKLILEGTESGDADIDEGLWRGLRISCIEIPSMVQSSLWASCSACVSSDGLKSDVYAGAKWNDSRSVPQSETLQVRTHQKFEQTDPSY